jgi:2-polyprenyl-6-methoxyphenol hydroxylase-like FAD-dependent oxidoreductase
MTHPAPDCDALIFGGGIAGLWTLCALVEAGHDALLVETHALGAGQTIASQGIIHGGLKYSLAGAAHGSARAIRDMPGVWRRCLRAESRPDLSSATLRTDHCHLWRTTGAASRLAMLGARLRLRVAPQRIASAERPAALAGCPGEVSRLDEQVFEPGTVLRTLADGQRGRVLHVRDWRFDGPRDGRAPAVHLTSPEGRSATLRPRWIVLAAGGGAGALRRALGLDPGAMQRRPLAMLLLRGGLPPLNGHCIDGARTRVTITSTRDVAGRAVWQVGGQLAERGAALDDDAAIELARSELRGSLPGLALGPVECSLQRIDRAEGRTRSGGRPEDAVTLVEGNVITAWPTKLALAPRLAAGVVRLCGDPSSAPSGWRDALHGWGAPPVATAPWDEPDRRWAPLDLAGGRR